MKHAPWIQTFSGKQVWLLEPRPEDVNISDIAHALSNLCRYTGHSSRFYSVAEHSMWASRYAPEKYRLTALMHDAAEAYVSDLSKPLKDLLPNYEDIEHRHWLAIAQRYDLPETIPPEVKLVDRRLLMAEHKVMFTPPPASWGYEDIEPILDFKPGFLAPRHAEWGFMRLFFSLRRGA